MKKNVQILQFLFLLTIGIGISQNLWAGGTYLVTSVNNQTGKGLVYANTSSATPALENYAVSSQSATQSGGMQNVQKDFYGWAKPSRGFLFSKWQAPTGGSSGQLTTWPTNPDGDCDLFKCTTPKMQTVASSAEAVFKGDNAYSVTYAQTIGGSYKVTYSYVKSVNKNGTYKLENRTKVLNVTPTSGDLMPEDTVNGDEVTKTYGSDVIDLETTETSFMGWYETPVDAGGAPTGVPVLLNSTLSSGKHTLRYTPNKNAIITAVFKSLTLGNADGDLSVEVHDTDVTHNDYVITIPTLDVLGSWEASDFTASFGAVTGVGTFTAGTIGYTDNVITIPFSFIANDWSGSTVKLTVTALTASKTITIQAVATELFDEEACIEENGVRTYKGDLTDMVAQANTMDNKPTVKIMNDIPDLNSMLSFAKSMTLDLNDKKVTGNTQYVISVDASDIDVKIIDSGFLKKGTIEAKSATNDIVSAIRFTQKAKLTFESGTIYSQNTAEIANNPNAKAYGVLVNGGSNFYMLGGCLSVTSDNNAMGVFVSTINDYSTIQGGEIVVNSLAKAYGINNQGNTNITNAKINVSATSGAESYGIYVNGGAVTTSNVKVISNAKTTNANGGYVKAGQLNSSGDSIAVEAEGSNVYGLNVLAGATAVLQQQTKVLATSTVSGTNIIGVQNLGTVKLYNVNVEATSPTNYATAVNSITSATATLIEDGTYSANTITGYAYGLHHQKGLLNVSGGTFTGIASNGSNVYGARAAVDATISNATLYGEAQGTGNTAYGFVGGTLGTTVLLTGCTIEAVSATSTARAVHTRANTTLTNCNLTATTIGTNNATGFYAEDGTNELINTNATVTSNTIEAYGINHLKGSMEVTGGMYTVTAKQATATANANTYAYGLKNAKNYTCTLTNVSFIVKGTNNSYAQNVYGVYASGTIISTNCNYNVQTKRYAYGLYGDGTSTLTLENNVIKPKAVIDYGAYGVYTAKSFSIRNCFINDTATTTSAYALNFGGNAVGTVENGKFITNGKSDFGPVTRSGSSANISMIGGYYTSATNLQYYTPSTYDVYVLESDNAEYANGYRYTIATENPSLFVCEIGSNKYTRLEDALEYVKNNPNLTSLIRMLQPYTLSAGDYELPANATLFIPYSVSQANIAGSVPNRSYTTGVLNEHLLLTLASGVNLNVHGQIEVSAVQYESDGGQVGRIQGPYSRIQMEEHSNIVLNDGSNLFAWGYITGSGNIIAKQGAYVYEMFQVMDMKTLGQLNDHYLASSQSCSPKVFPISQYYIQNIEVPTTYYYDSHLVAAMAIYHPTLGERAANTINLIGKYDCLFQITDNNEATWVRKRYDTKTDRQIWEINSAAELGSMKISLDGVSMDSKDYVLPLTNNMTIHIFDGNMDITQDVEIRPGAEIEIDKTASASLNAGKRLYLFDLETKQYTYMSKDKEVTATANLSTITKLTYSPSWVKGTCPRSSTINPATINIHGILNIGENSKIYTTTKGASIISSQENAGTINFSSANGSDTQVYFIVGNDPYTLGFDVNPAKLKNGSGAASAYLSTSDASNGDSYIYKINSWQKSYINGCFRVIGDSVFAKPSEYIALKDTQWVAGRLEGKPNADHTYTTIENKLLICQSNCEWWEVTKVEDNLFYCAKPGYEGYYYYSDGQWLKKTVVVSFYNDEEHTSLYINSIVGYNDIPDQSVVATNPTKASTAAASYQFYGWKSSVTGDTTHYTDELEPATSDMYYTPVFTKNIRRYTITLKDANNGQTIIQEVAYGDVPSYDAVKEPSAQYSYNFLSWSPTFAAVTGPATYTANWEANVNLYTITWMNEGTVLKTDKNQMYGLATSAPATAPTKDMDDEFVYTFAGWTSSLTGDTTKLPTTTPTVTGNTTYSAYYTTTPRYLITFINYDGEVLQQEPVTQGVVPAYADVPRRDPDRDGYFKFDGWKNSNGDKFDVGAALPAVTQKETYTSQWEYVSTVFAVTFVNYDGEGTSTGGLRFGEGEIPSCPEIVAKEPTTKKEYTLDYWVATSDGQNYSDPLPAVSKDETYTAVFAESDRQYTITWIDGNGDELKAEQVAYDSIPVYSGVTPTKASTAEKEYTFNGSWSPAVVAVSGDATYTAQFNESAVRYAITWINGNGSILKTDTVAVGVTPVYTGETPTKATTATQIFTFNNTWAPAVVAVSGDATYRAQFDITVRTYEIIFKDHDNTELKRAQYEYGVTPTCPQPSREGYVFTGWNPAISAVTVAQTYTAQYEELVAIVKHNNVSTPYGSLSAAVNAVQSGDTVVMQKDYNQGSEITFNKNMTLDLNGKTLSSTGDKIFKFSGNPVNIIDSSNSSTGKISTIGGISGDLYAVDVVNGGVLNLRSGTIYARNNLNDSKDKARVGAVRMDGGTFNMYGGNLRGICDKSYAYVIYQGASTVNIYGGDLYAEATTASKREWIIYNNNVSANLNIYGGEFRSAHNNTGDNGSYSSTKSGTINVSGGKFKGHNGTNTFKSSVSNVTGGYFVKTGNVSAKSGYQAIALTDKHPEYANDYRYVVEVPRSITWDANGGTISTPTSDYVNGVVASGTSLAGAATPADPTRAGHTFIGWDSTLPETMPTEDVTITALWELIPEVTTAVEYTGNVEAENLTITTTGSVNVTSGSTLSLTNLYIQANASASGELFGAGTIEVDNAYMDYTFNGNAFNRAKQNWYAFAVPFEVDATTLQYKKANGSFAACGLGTAIDIIYYDGDTRATQGAKVNAWKYVEDLGDKTLKPGTLYLATFSKDEYANNTVRFAKKAASALISSNTVATAPHASSITTDANWNGIANPALCYSTLSSDTVSVGQIYEWSDNDESNYKTVELTEALSVGKPIFIQTTETVAVATKADRPSAAPKRMLANTDTKSALVDVRITAEGNNKYSDRLFVATDENAKNEYTIGADVVKAGVATKCAQMWVNNYNQKLCLNTVAPIANVAEYALGISVPVAGAYVIEQASENDGTLYLTHNGEAIWNLSDMPYTLTLEAGTNSSYGLRWVKTIPGVVTNLEEAAANAKQGETLKLIKDNHLLIISNGRVYDAQGAQLR